MNKGGSNRQWQTNKVNQSPEVVTTIKVLWYRPHNFFALLSEKFSSEIEGTMPFFQLGISTSTIPPGQKQKCLFISNKINLSFLQPKMYSLIKRIVLDKGLLSFRWSVVGWPNGNWWCGQLTKWHCTSTNKRIGQFSFQLKSLNFAKRPCTHCTRTFRSKLSLSLSRDFSAKRVNFFWML